MLVVGVLAAGALGVWALAHVHNGGGMPVAAGTTSASSSVPTPAEPFDAAGSVRDQVLSTVFVQANDPTTAHDIIRTGGSSHSCNEPPPGISPRGVVLERMRSAFTTYAVLDVARVIDQFAGVCVVDARARGPQGTVLVVRVSSPVDDEMVVEPRVDAGEALSDDALTQFVRVSTRDGWVITVGTSGPPAVAPSRAGLTTLAEQQSLRW